MHNPTTSPLSLLHHIHFMDTATAQIDTLDRMIQTLLQKYTDRENEVCDLVLASLSTG